MFVVSFITVFIIVFITTHVYGSGVILFIVFYYQYFRHKYYCNHHYSLIIIICDLLREKEPTAVKRRFKTQLTAFSL